LSSNPKVKIGDSFIVSQFPTNEPLSLGKWDGTIYVYEYLAPYVPQIKTRSFLGMKFVTFSAYNPETILVLRINQKPRLLEIEEPQRLEKFIKVINEKVESIKARLEEERQAYLKQEKEQQIREKRITEENRKKTEYFFGSQKDNNYDEFWH
jgi:hypothetical protein